MDGEDWVATYRAMPGVYGGAVVMCLHCKGMTFYPGPIDMHEALSREDVRHRYGCDVFLQWLITQLLD
jgi:hypothetical protein